MTYPYSDEQVLKAAVAAHECNRIYCVATGDNSQVPWEWAEQWQKDASVNLVKDIIAHGAAKGGKERHEQWCQDKYNAGWKFGPVKDGTKKEHPCLVAYHALPLQQQVKDTLVDCVVNSVLAALADMEERLPGAE